VQAWVEEITGKPWPEASFGEALKDGKILVKLSNKVRKLGGPNMKKLKANTSKLGFKQMENISGFLQNCRALGMAEQELFCTPDLYEKKNLALVVDGLFAFASHVQAKTPGYEGPTLGSGASHKGGKKFEGKSYAGATLLSMGSRGIQEKAVISRSRDIGFGRDASGESTGGVSQLSMGSRGIMDETEVSRAKDIGFGADAGQS
jgi:hypothetical protein